ncbi:hypothetical protein PF010_g32368 [Phytophthora fragariae]|uniref:Uncharacterized protein n=1 Tax=Phytophthora fragariae TaxID=53985 RepID=A0A6G0JEV7_9STRA|nr:hypothetical protein PF010_g32368 [Phytophthora fragariae]
MAFCAFDEPSFLILLIAEILFTCCTMTGSTSSPRSSPTTKDIHSACISPSQAATNSAVVLDRVTTDCLSEPQ